jgi:hypothetical protein
MNYFLFILIVTLCFIIYVEFNVGGIVYRFNSKNIKTIHFNSLINYLIHPLKSLFLWNIKLLDVNYIFVLFISSIFYIFYLTK